MPHTKDYTTDDIRELEWQLAELKAGASEQLRQITRNNEAKRLRRLIKDHGAEPCR